MPDQPKPPNKSTQLDLLSLQLKAAVSDIARCCTSIQYIAKDHEDRLKLLEKNWE